MSPKKQAILEFSQRGVKTLEIAERAGCSCAYVWQTRQELAKAGLITIRRRKQRRQQEHGFPEMHRFVIYDDADVSREPGMDMRLVASRFAGGFRGDAR